MKLILVLGILVVCFAFLVLIIALIKYLNLFIQSLLSDATIFPWTLFFMSLRKVRPRIIVEARIRSKKAGLEIHTEELESHYMAGGNVDRVVNAVIAADKATLDLSYKTACGIDLAGRDILEAVHTSVYPKVIDCPDPVKGKTTVDAVAKDGIQLMAKARVTVRTNLKQLIGGATEETIIARVGEGIVTSIGSATTHKEVLENPDTISQKVLGRGLDSGTAFEILSIDIADIDVGKNIGAILQADQAEADKRVAQAKAESRRAMAVAAEQEMQARVQEMQAKVVEAEAEVPLAMAHAFREGNLGIMDYYTMRNVVSDTRMRDSIADDSEPNQPGGN